jgi:hypothetical protein
VPVGVDDLWRRDSAGGNADRRSFPFSCEDLAFVGGGNLRGDKRETNHRGLFGGQAWPGQLFLCLLLDYCKRR